jgi:DnaJ like chaperone protein
VVTAEGNRVTTIEDTAFRHALVALAAKLACVDGVPSHAEYAAFSALFIGDDLANEGRLKSLFIKHVSDDSSAFQYARQLLAATPGDSQLHEELIERLIRLALSDGPLNAIEMELIRAVAAVFAIQGVQLKAILAKWNAATGSAYDVLGVARSASDADVRAQYMAQVQKFHPDRYQAVGASHETVSMLSERLAAINAAYDEITTQRAKRSGFALRTNNKGARD